MGFESGSYSLAQTSFKLKAILELSNAGITHLYHTKPKALLLKTALLRFTCSAFLNATPERPCECHSRGETQDTWIASRGYGHLAQTRALTSRSTMELEFLEGSGLPGL